DGLLPRRPEARADRERAARQLRRALPRGVRRAVAPSLPRSRGGPAGRLHGCARARRAPDRRPRRLRQRRRDGLHLAAHRAGHPRPVLAGAGLARRAACRPPDGGGRRARRRRPPAARSRAPRLMPLGAVTLDAAGTLFEVAEPVGVTYARVAARHGIGVTATELDRAFRAALAGAPPLAFPGASPV